MTQNNKKQLKLSFVAKIRKDNKYTTVITIPKVIADVISPGTTVKVELFEIRGEYV